MHPYTKQFYARIGLGSQTSAAAILPLVLEWVQPCSVVDVGCGVGTWLAVAQRCGVEDVLGLDGVHVERSQLCIPAALFQPVDLNAPPPLARHFDLVLSLEVAEHLAPAQAAGFIRYLTSLGPVVLFSAAIPHQLGEGHLNEQWPAYWAALFAKYDYVAVDCLRPRFWQHPEVEFWYAQNALLYVKQGHPCLSRLLTQTPAWVFPEPLPLIHPALFLRQQAWLTQLQAELARPRWTLREVLSALPMLVRRALAQRLRRVTSLSQTH